MKNKQVGLHQTKNLLYNKRNLKNLKTKNLPYNKRNDQWREKIIYRIGKIFTSHISDKELLYVLYSIQRTHIKNAYNSTDKNKNKTKNKL